jgi:hypothetical protein
MTLTVERDPIWIGGPAAFAGMRVISDINCLKDTTERLFPISCHRSARIHKKLIRRFGGVYRKEPAMVKAGNIIICHPAIYNEVKRQIQ